jgi:hypothetical protein
MIWHRRPGESVQAYTAFELYRDFGPKRSLKLTATELAKSSNLMERWSRRWAWVARCQEFDRYYEARHAELVHDKRMKAINRQARLGGELQEVALRGTEALLASDSIDLSAGEIAKLAEVGTRIERLAMGDSTENVHETGIQLVYHGEMPPWAPTPDEPVVEPPPKNQRALTAKTIVEIDDAKERDAVTAG